MKDKSTNRDLDFFFKQAVERIKKKYDERESYNITTIVFQHIFGISNFRIYKEVDLDKTLRINKIIERLESGEPLQYVLEEADFYGLKIKVNSSVLIPRPETEELVHWVLSEIQNSKFGHDLKIIDIGTGSGCIPLAIKYKIPEILVSGYDISPQALLIARENARRLNLDVQFCECDILTEDCLEQEIDTIISNPPYIPKKESDLLSENVIEYEPHLALFVDNEDPLIFYNKIAALGLAKLNPGGIIFLECNEHNIAAVCSIFADAGYNNILVKQDMQGKERMLKIQIA